MIMVMMMMIMTVLVVRMMTSYKIECTHSRQVAWGTHILTLAGYQLKTTPVGGCPATF